MTGNLRLVFPTPTWEDYQTLAFDEICQYDASSVQVLRRLRSALLLAAFTTHSKNYEVDAMWLKNPLILLCLVSPLLGGCASIARGVTEGIMGTRGEEAQQNTGVCAIRGPAFAGIAPALEQQATTPGRTVKVLMIHGIGRHLPGYSGRLQDKLTAALGLDVVQEQYKAFTLSPPPPRPELNLGDQPLGTLRVNRYTNKSGSRELLFYELTWSTITDPTKAILAYDTTSEYAYHRATLNRVAKEFINSHIPDPIIYTGDTHQKILVAVTQSLCWMSSGDWDALPTGGQQRCNALEGDKARHIREDTLVIITHSLGSRIAMDALQAMAASALVQRLGQQRHPLVQALQDKEIPVYMLANQLPLLQLGFVKPEITGQHDRYCQAGGDRYDQRMFRQVRIVAFSDPNDLLSYAVPPQFAEEFIDSRLCPQVVNVTVNVAPVTALPVIGDFANPLAAHNDYEADERGIGLITNGIGTGKTAPVVATRCQWVETRRD